MHRQRGAIRGLSAALTIALGLWIFGGAMPGMAGQSTVAMAMPAAGAAAVAAPHAQGGTPSRAPHSQGTCGLCIGCCPGSTTPPPNPLGLRFDAAPAPLESPVAAVPALPRRAVAHHWQPQPLGPPAPLVS